jgi:hypothetical protein
LPRLEDVIYRKVHKYKHVPGLDLEALLQEARLLAIYAIDRWDRKRGKKLRGWVDVVVRHGLHAEVNWQKALKRAPRIRDPISEETRRFTNSNRERYQRLAEFIDTGILAMMPAEEVVTLRQYYESVALVEKVLLQLNEKDRRIIRLKMNPPPDLVVCARNQRPKSPRVTDKLIAEYLRIPVARIKRATQLAKDVWRSIDGGA